MASRVGRERGRGRAGGLRRLPGTLLLTVLLTVTAGCSPMDDLMVAVFGRSMRSQPSFDPYENPLPPPEGSVPFASGNVGATPNAFNVGAPLSAEVPPPITQLQVARQDPIVTAVPNPVAADAASLARGQVVFERFCGPCHGVTGAGDGTITQAGMPVWPLTSANALQYTDGYIYGMIRVGRGLMPAYGMQVSHFDRWHVVNYVRQLQGQASTGAGGAGANGGSR